MNQRTFIQTWIDSIISDTIDTTIGNSSTIKYRNWEVNATICRYKNQEVIKYVHGLFLINPKYKWISHTFDNYKITPIFVSDFSSFESNYQMALFRFKECAENSYFLKKEIYQIVHNCNHKFDNKYLNYCKTLNYRKFVQIASKHRERNKNSEIMILKGLWYERTFVSRKGK